MVNLPTDPITNFFSTAGVGLMGVVTEYPVPVSFACAIAAGVITSYSVLRWQEKRRFRKDAIAEQQERDLKRRAQLDEIYSEKFHDILFEMYVNNVISKHEYRRDCRRFGLAYRFNNLLVRKQRNKDIKHRVKYNVLTMHSTMSTVQPSIPGPKPGEGLPPPIPVQMATKRKVWIVVGKQRRG